MVACFALLGLIGKLWSLRPVFLVWSWFCFISCHRLVDFHLFHPLFLFCSVISASSCHFYSSLLLDFSISVSSSGLKFDTR